MANVFWEGERSLEQGVGAADNPEAAAVRTHLNTDLLQSMAVQHVLIG